MRGRQVRRQRGDEWAVEAADVCMCVFVRQCVCVWCVVSARACVRLRALCVCACGLCVRAGAHELEAAELVEAQALEAPPDHRHLGRPPAAGAGRRPGPGQRRRGGIPSASEPAPGSGCDPGGRMGVDMLCGGGGGGGSAKRAPAAPSRQQAALGTTHTLTSGRCRSGPRLQPCASQGGCTGLTHSHAAALQLSGPTALRLSGTTRLTTAQACLHGRVWPGSCRGAAAVACRDPLLCSTTALCPAALQLSSRCRGLCSCL
jgi:hypothetical protein